MEKFDEQDRALLGFLQLDAALSVGDLAEKIGISKSACWRRIRNSKKPGSSGDG